MPGLQCVCNHGHIASLHRLHRSQQPDDSTAADAWDVYTRGAKIHFSAQSAPRPVKGWPHFFLSIGTVWNVSSLTPGKSTRSSALRQLFSLLLHFYRNQELCLLFDKKTSAQQLLRWATVWPQQTWAENWGYAPFLGRGSRVPI